MYQAFIWVFFLLVDFQQHLLVRLYVIIMSHVRSRVNLYFTVCLNIKELLAQSGHYIWSLSGSNEIGTHNHLACKRTLNHLAKLASLTKWLSFHLWGKWLRVWILFLLVSIASSQKNDKMEVYHKYF